MELPAAASLRLAVDEHLLGGQHLLRVAPAPRDSRELEQLTELDRLAGDLHLSHYAGESTSGAPPTVAAMSSKARVMVIALDAADPGLIRELARAGEMPAIASFFEGAAEVSTLAPVGVCVSANWPTIFTASFPDRHGYLCWNEFVGGTYDYRETDPTMVRGTPFWETLSEAGRRVAVIDVPHSIA